MIILNEKERNQLRDEIQSRQLGSLIVSEVSAELGRKLSRNNLVMLYRKGADTPVRRKLYATALKHLPHLQQKEHHATG